MRLDELVEQMAELYFDPAVLLRWLWLTHQAAAHQLDPVAIILG
jgi:hypothetical protein